MSTAAQDDVVLIDKKPHKPARAKAMANKLHPHVHRHRKKLFIIGGVLLLLALIYYTHDALTHEETDNAYVTGHLHYIATRINGVVTEVLVKDNQQIHKGDVLVRLDPEEYTALQIAAKAQLSKAEADMNRQKPLVDVHAISPQDLDATRSTVAVDLAQLKLAELQIEYSTIVAPSDGTIGRKNVEVGNRVSAGQTLMVLVEPELWVVANFKETQIADMYVGQHATITIDSIPGHVFTGRVDSFSPATGNAFALLPADNSTGNFTKIVQRVPVKIIFDPKPPQEYWDRIRAGESAIVRVTLTRPPGK